MTTQSLVPQKSEQLVDDPATVKIMTTTQKLLIKDRERATDILLQLKFQFSRTVSSIEIKR